MVVATTLAAVASGIVPGATAAGDTTVVVHGVALPDLARSRLGQLGCADVFGRTSQVPAPMIGVVPHGPAGKRSVAFDLGTGDAVGPVSYVDQVAATTVAGTYVHADDGTTGVVYVGYQPPADSRTTLMWIGRADLSVPAGQWTDVDATGRQLVWTRYDMSTRQSTGETATAATLADFVAQHGGDGYGFYAFGFGCDGNPFNMDAWRIGRPGAVTTYDFDGYQVQVSGGRDRTIAPGDTATLTADVAGATAADARVVLEQKQDGDWVPVATKAGSHVSVDVQPTETTTYRWKVYSTAMVEGDQTAPFTVTVDRQAATPPTSDPTPPASTPASAPADTPASTPAQQDASTPASQQHSQQHSQPASSAPKPEESSAPAQPEQPGPTASDPPAPGDPSSSAAAAPGAAEAPAG